jgi:AraC-like DNA-binding protein
MKILPFKIAKPVNESCWIQDDRMPHLYDILHRHEEFQITLIMESTGQVIAGNKICNFMPGDIFVFGANLPHAFRNDADYYNQDSLLEARALSVYFDWHVFGEVFWSLPENRLLTEFHTKALRGIQYQGTKDNRLSEMLLQLSAHNELDRLILLLGLLKELAITDQARILSSTGVYSVLNETDEKRLDAVYRFTLNEYHRQIPLQEAAGKANMTVNSFCRYFKTRTRKSYLEFLTEYRIGQACRLLQQEELTISEIAYRVGFGNLSNFNRKFLEYSGCTPRDYRRKQSLQNLKEK